MTHAAPFLQDPNAKPPKNPKPQPAKPLIGINVDYRPQNGKTFPLIWSNAGYSEAVAQAGGIPQLLVPTASDDDLRAIISRLDGIVLTGCKLDLDHARQGFDPHPVSKSMPQLREDFDRRLATLAHELSIPVLAIGSGMQVMNLVLGGTLFQHIPEDVLRPLQHRDPVEQCLRHLIEIVPGTRLDHLYGPGEIRVNSDHHMAIDHLAGNFRVCATAPDGVVEAYESTSEDWFCLGVQWHPESASASALDMQIFEEFVEAARPAAAGENANILKFAKAA